MHAKYWLLAAMLVSLTTLSACSLLPMEEPERTAPLISSYRPETYETAVAQRGELALIEKINCKYVPIQTEFLSFAVGGEYVDKVFVQVGDAVEKDQLLAQLQLDNLEEQIQSTENAVDELTLRQSYLERFFKIDLARHEILAAEMTAQEQQEALEALEEDHAVRRQSLEDALLLQRLTLETLEAQLAERQIRAPFAGTVTYVRSFEEGDRSEFAQNVLTLADSTMSIFRAETPYWDRFVPGDEYEITVDKVPYTVVVTDEAALGLAPQERVAGKKAFVYFALKETNVLFEDGNTGVIQLVLERREDALYVPSSAVVASGDRYLVFYLDKNGLKTYKEVEIGLTVDRKTEILSGLTEGESVIVG